jgi:hypothetical protein
MGTSIGKWNVSTSLDASGFSSGNLKMQQDAKRTLESVGGSFEALKGKVGSLGSALSGWGIGAFLGGGALASGLQGALDKAHQLGESMASYARSGMDAIRIQDRLSTQLGVSRDHASALLAVGRAGGIEPGGLGELMFGAQRHLGALGEEMAMGHGGNATRIFDRLGISAQQFFGLGVDEQLTTLGAAFRNVSDGNERANLQFQILGRHANELRPFLDQTTSSLERIAQDSRSFGAVADSDLAGGLRGTNAQMRELRIVSDLAAEGLRVQFAAGLTEATHGSSRLADQLQRIRDTAPGMSENARTIGSATGHVASAMNMPVSFLARHGSSFVNWISGLHGRLMPQIEMEAVGGNLSEAEPRNIGGEAAASRLTALEHSGTSIIDRLRDYNQGLTAGASALERELSAWTGIDDITRSALRSQLERNAATEQALSNAREARSIADAAETRQGALVSGTQSPFQQLLSDAQFLRNQRNTGALSEFDFGTGMANLLASVPRPGAAPLLGSLSEGGTDTAAVLQAAMSPQVSEEAEIRAVLEAMRDEDRRHGQLLQELRDAVLEGRDLITPFFE